MSPRPMRPNAIRTKLAAGGYAINAWCSLPCAYSAEILAHQGYDAVTIDLQHGAMHFETAFAMLQAISTTDATPFVRVPWNEPGLLMKLLDAGAYGVICPMVNSPSQANEFVRACRYPPRGFRSYGPGRVVQYANAGSGAQYAREADAHIMLLAQIETSEAVRNLDAILATDGLDGVYVGPGDLSLALGAPPSMAPTNPTVLETMATIVAATRAVGKISAVHTDGPDTAVQRIKEGFQICTLQNDVRLLIDGAAAQVRAIRQHPQKPA